MEFQDGCHGLLIGMILAFFDLQVTLMFPTWFKVNKPFGSEEEVKNSYFQDGHHLGFPIRTLLAIFDPYDFSHF